MHASGVLADGLIGSQTAGSVRRVLGAKSSRLTLVQQLAALQPLASGVLFSSVASLLGSPGQANYSAANAALDQLAVVGRQAGLVGVSVQWGAWAAGMAANDLVRRKVRPGLLRAGSSFGASLGARRTPPACQESICVGCLSSWTCRNRFLASRLLLPRLVCWLCVLLLSTNTVTCSTPRCCRWSPGAWA